MRWTVVDAGTTGRLYDCLEDARGRWWIADDVVRVSADRGATWRVALVQWTRALAVDGDGIWAGGNELYWSRDGADWQHSGRALRANRRRWPEVALARSRSHVASGRGRRRANPVKQCEPTARRIVACRRW